MKKIESKTLFGGRVEYTVYESDYSAGRPKLVPKNTLEATFLEFGVQYDTLRSQRAGSQSSAIIMTDDGSVLNVPLPNIRFIVQETGDS